MPLIAGMLGLRWAIIALLGNLLQRAKVSKLQPQDNGLEVVR